jgi:hypothetical protein
MAVVAHVVERTMKPGMGTVDGIVAMVLAIDNAVDTDAAAIKARAVTVANAAGIPLPDDYFDTNRLVSTYDAAGDVTMFSGQIAYHAIA